MLAVEGTKTEPQYFTIFNRQGPVNVKCLNRPGGSDPFSVLKRMSQYLKVEGLKASDQAWLVVDKDQWTEQQLVQLNRWGQKQQNHGFALSNPNFELWLLLHFEAGTDISSSQDCANRLRKHLPNYNKAIRPGTFSRVQVEEAVKRAKQHDTPPCNDWPRSFGGTTIYKLVEEILVACNGG